MFTGGKSAGDALTATAAEASDRFGIEGLAGKPRVCKDLFSD